MDKSFRLSRRRAKSARWFKTQNFGPRSKNKSRFSFSPKYRFEQLRKMMGVIVVVCAAFGLTVSEAKTEIMCLRAKGMPESTATFSVEAAG